MNDILDYGNENVLEFIQSTIKNNNNVKEDILDKMEYVYGKVIEKNIVEDHSSQGFYYERLWDLCIKFGVTNLTLPATINGKLQTSHIINENPNETGIDFQSNCWDGNQLDKNPGGYLRKKVRSGNSGGYSDITFLNQHFDDKGNKTGDEELYFISVKYFIEEKQISEYDIGKICSLIRQHEKKNRIIKLYIFVKNKKNAIDKFKKQHSSSNILIKYINPEGNYEHIYDINDLQESFFKLKKVLEQYDYLQSSINIQDFQSNYLNVLKDVFIPRFHQELFILKINKLIENKEKNILVGAIPRSGKSYIMAGTILEYVRSQEKLHPGKKVKFLLMTPSPNDTFGEYENIFNKYIEFDKLGIDVVTYKDGVNSRTVCKNKDKHCVIIISKQKLGWSAGSNSEKILAKDNEDITDEYVDYEDKTDEEENDEDKTEEDDLEENDSDVKTIKKRIIKLFDAIPDIDIMFLDEAHFGMSTKNAQQIVKVLDNAISNTIKIYVTATYNKPLQAYGVKAECKITWDMNDIHIMQKINKETIKDNSILKQFGSDIYVKALEYFGDKTGISLIDKFKKDYAIFPKPYLITSIWDKEFLNVEKLKIGDTDFAWDMNKLFATKGNSDNLENEEQMKEMMRYYFGYPDKNEEYDKQSFYRIRGILPRIRNICLNKCRTLQPQHKTTQLWFLPLGNGKIKNKIKELINLLTNANEFNDVKRNYHFFIAVDIEDKTKKGRNVNGVTYMGNPRNIKNDIENCEKEMKEGTIKKDNLIILAGQRLQLGISLRNVDIVTLWNSTSSADAIFQMLFRSMTEVDVPPCKPYEYCDGKKFGFMVDMNPQRALTNISLFDSNISKKDANDIQNYRQITDLINIDEDVLFDKYGDDEKGRNDFVKDLFNKLYSSWNINVENTRKIISNFSFDMTKLEALKKAFEKINIDKNKKTKDIIDEKDDDEMIDPGKKKEKTGQTKKKYKNDVKEKEINLTETASELISEFISLLNIFTLYADKGAQCILTDSSKSNAQITLIDDIELLKKSVYQDKETKDMFLEILNGRLSGNADEPYPEHVIEDVLDAMDNSYDKLVVNKIIMSQKKQYYTIHEPDELLEFINRELKPKEKEKKEHGEVFTPLSLVEEMLNKLDETYTKEHGKSIFTEVGFKWFDPAVGIGNFPIIVYKRLMEGLTTQITDEEERRKHILEHMIYSAELTQKNVFVYNKIFCGDKYKLNIYEGDTLKMDIKKEFKLPADFGGFDVVMGNPPFQKKVGPNKTETLWGKFIIKSLTLLKSSGYLVFVNPSGWRNIDGKFKSIQKEILTRDLQYLEIHNEKDGLKTFSSETRYDWYVLKNELVDNTNTIIKFQDGTTNIINVNGLEFIPNGEYEQIMSMIAKNGEESVKVIYSRSLYGTDKKHMSRTKTEEYKYPCVYTVNSKSEPSFFYSSIKHGHFGVPKFIWSNGRISSIGSYVDINGDYGLTQFAYAIVDKPENLQKIKEVFDSKDFRNLMELCAVGQLTVNYKVISIFKKDFWKVFLDNKDEDEIEVAKDQTPKKSPIKLDKTSTLIPKTKAIENISTAIQSSTPKKNRTIKKSTIKKIINPNSEKIFNPSTNRYIKNTTANKKKIQRLTLKQGGKSKKRTRKNKDN